MVDFGNLIFVECGGLDVPFLWEDGRLEFLKRRRSEVESHYGRLIHQYERMLDDIQSDRIRKPNDHSHHSMELLYKQRLVDARRKQEEALEDIRDEEQRIREREEAQRRADHEWRNRKPSLRNRLTYGYGTADILPA